MKKLVKYASKAKFMNVNILLDGKTYSFNLDTELKVQLTRLTGEIKDQPRQYAFLAMLRQKLVVKQRDLEKELKRKKDGMFVNYKKTIEKVTEANAKVNTDKDVQKMQDRVDHIADLKHVLDICLTAFDQRGRLIQTLSANERKEFSNS
jgi:hypothetical protein